MLGWLSDIWHAIMDLPYLLVGLLIESVNGWILILAVLLKALFAVLPSFPDLPDISSEVLGGVAWFLPIGPMLGALSAFVAAFVIWLGVQVAMRWGKAI
jgi:hypothetical protein